jgi:ribose transport system ATP-binding protein
LLAVNTSVKDNIAISGLDINILFGPFMSSKKEKQYVDKQVKSLSVKCNSVHDLISSLSGGNKQKVGFAKWLANDPDIIIMDCPTRGIDIGVKQEVYRLMYEIKKQNKTIILISEEMTELIGMSDRLLIMKNGVIAKEFMRSENISEHDVIEYMV